MNPLSFFCNQEMLFHSEISGEIKVSEFLRNKTLYVNGVSQSGGEYVYMWNKVIGRIRDLSIRNCLVLGVGGGTVIHILKKNLPRMHILGVEIDPLMITISEKYFDLTMDSTISIEIADASSWIKKQIQSNIFDMIVVDLFCGRLNPSFTRKRRFLFRLKSLLTKKGMIFYNAHYQPQEPLEYTDFIKICKLVFRHVEETFRYKYNRVIILQ